MRISIWRANGEPFSFSIAGAITDHDPSFSLDAFIPFAEAVFLRVNRARAEGRLEPVRRLLADGLQQEFQAEGPKPERTGLVISSAEATQSGQDGSWDSVAVRFVAQAPERRGRPLVEDWIFQRPTAASTATGGGSAAAASGAEQECPVCGAPLSLTDEGTCRYCGAAARGGLGGWRLVRTAPPRPDPAARLSRRSTSMGGRLGCILTTVVLAAILPPLIVTLVVTGVTAGVVHRALSETPVTNAGQLSGHASFTGAVNGDRPGTVTLPGGVTGSCSSRARHATGLTFTDIESSESGRKVLAAHVDLPPGTEGPGTYDLATTGIQLSVSYALSPGQAGGKAEGQIWKAQPGKTRAVLVIRPDASGTLTVSGLAPSLPQPPGSTLGEPLNFMVSFSCG